MKEAPYRSDQDALLARNRALEAENQRLEARLTVLEEKAEGLKRKLSRVYQLEKDNVLLSMEVALARTDPTKQGPLEQLEKRNEAMMREVARTRREQRTIFALVMLFLGYGFVRFFAG